MGARLNRRTTGGKGEDGRRCMTLSRPASFAATLAAAGLAFAAPASAHDRRGGGHDAAIAIGVGVIGVGVIGLAIGAAIASDHDEHRGYYEGGYYPYKPHYRAYPYPAYRTYRAYPVYREYQAYPRINERWERERHWREHRRRDHEGGEYEGGWHGW